MIMMKNLNRRISIPLIMVWCMLFLIVGNTYSQDPTAEMSNSIVVSKATSKKLKSIQKQLNKGNYSVLSTASSSSSSLKSGINDVLECIDASYCYKSDSVLLYPNPDFEVAGATYRFYGYYLDPTDPTNYRASYVKKDATTGDYYFHPESIDLTELGSQIAIVVWRVEGGTATESQVDYTVVKPLPTGYHFGEDGTICDGGVHTLELSGSDYEVGNKTTYNLYREGEASYIESQEGDGSALSFDISVAGTYYVIAQNNIIGCPLEMTDDESVPNRPVVTVYNKPVVTPSGDVSICSGQSTTISVSSDMDPDVTYTWDDGSGGSAEYTGVSWEVSPTVTTIYTVRGTNNTTGCYSEDNVTVTVNANPTITASSNSPICEGSSIVLSSVPAGGSGTYDTFAWTGPDSFSASTQNSTIVTSSLSNSGDYYITVTDDNGCSSDATDMTTVVVTEKPTVTLSYNNPVCLNTELVLTAAPTGGSGNYVNYVWTKGGVVISGENGSTLTIASAALSDAATYGVSVEDDSGCISDEVTEIVVINSLPVVSAGNDGPVCEGGTINLSGGTNGMSSYTWSGPGGYSNLTQNPQITNIALSNAGTYTLEIVDVNGCVNSITTDVVVNANPTITASSNSPICEGSSIVLSSVPAGGSGTYDTFAWTGPDSFSASTQNATIATSSLSNSGDYYITVTDDNGCSSDATDMTTVVVTERPTVTLSYNNPVCLNTELVLTAAPTGGSGNYVNYVWTKGGVVISGENGSTLTIASAALSDAATYGVSVEDDSGCISDEVTEIVVINSLPVVSAGNDGPVCEGGTINLSGGTNGMSSYTWSGPGGYSNLTQNPQITNIALSNAGTYTLEIVDVNGCVNSITTDVVVNANPTITASSNSPICEGSSIVLSSVPAGGSGTYDTFAWTGPDSFSVSTQNSTIVTSSLSNSGDYYITVTDDNGCSSAATDMTTVVVTEKPTVTLSYNNPVCLNTELVLTAAPTGGSGNYVNYVWTKGGVVISGENGSTLTIASAALSDAATYGVSVEDDSGCISDEVTEIVVINSLPVVSAGNDGPVCEGGTINLSGGTNGMSSYTWSGPGGYSNLTQNPQITNIALSNAGTYTLEIVDVNGCVNSITTDVVVNANPIITASSNSPICEGSSIVLSSVPAGGSGTYDTFAWTGPDSFSASTQNATIATSSLSNSGDYYITVTDDNGCISDATTMTTVVVSELPTVSLGYNDKVCRDTELVLTAAAAGGGGNYVNYIWTKDGVVISGENGSTLTIASAALTDAGTYGVTVVDDITCSSSEATVVVTIYDLPTATATNGGPICEGKSVNLFGGENGMVSYNWSGPDAFSSTDQNPTISDIPSSGGGVYTLLIEDVNGCQQSATTEIFVNRLTSSISVTSPVAGETKFCEGTEVIFTAVAEDGSGDYTYDFHIVRNSVDSSVKNSTDDTYTTTTLEDGDQVYVLILDNTSGCSESSSIVTTEIVAEPTPTLNITSPGSNVVCLNTAVDFSATPGYDRYIFYNDGVDVLQDGTSNLFTSNTLVDGNKITVEAYTGSCAGLSNEFVMTVNPLPTTNLSVDGGETTVCENESVNFTATASGTGTLTYQFLVDGAVAQAISETNTFTHSSTNDFSVQVRVLDDNNCEIISDPIDITISKPVASLSIGDNEICANTEVTFTASGGIDYEFFVNSGSVQGPNSTNTYSTTALDNNDIVSVEVTDAYGCTASTSGTQMTVNPIPVVSVSSSDIDNTICYGEEVTYTISGGDTYEWYLNGTIINGETGLNYVTSTLIDGDVVTGRGIYGSTGCYSEASAPVVTVNSLPVGTLSVSPAMPIVEGTEITFTAGGGDSYEWYLSGTKIDGETNSIYISSALTDGDEVTVKVTNDVTTCSSTVSTTITVYDGITPLDVLTNDTDNAYCEGDGGISIYLGGTPQSGVTYTLIKVSDNSIVGSAIEYDGTTDVRWDNIPGTEEYRVEGSYGSIVGSEVAMINTVIITENLLPSTLFNMDPTGQVTGCNGGTGYDITIDGSELDIDYILYLNGTEISTLSGTGNLIDFGTQTVVGIYTIEAVNTTTGCTNSFSETFEILDDGSNVAFNVYAVGKSDPTDGRYCNTTSPTGIEIGLDGSLDNTVTYKLYLDGVDTGIAVTGTSSAISFGTTLTEGTYTVRVESSTGCQYPMSGYVDVMAVDTPESYDLISDDEGHYCDGGTGVTLRLEDQQENIEYNLYKDGVLVETKIGSDAAGTPLTFDGVYTEGDYYVDAIVTDVLCSTLSDTYSVVMDVFTTYDVISDNTEYCTGESTQIYIEESETNSNIAYYLVKVEADGTRVKQGDLVIANGLQVSFDVSAEGDYSIDAVNTISGCESSMNGVITITVKPLPVDAYLRRAELGTGCDNGDSLYIQTTELGVEYTLVKYNGSEYVAVNGYDPIIGDGGDLGFERVIDTNDAAYNVLGNKDGCYKIVSPTDILVNVPNVIEKQTVTGSGDICNGDPGVVFGLADTEVDVIYELILESTGSVMSTITGDGNAMSFDAVNDEGDYYVNARAADGSCELEMLNNVTLEIHPLPIAYTMFGSGQTCDIAGDGALIGLPEYESTYTYQLQRAASVGETFVNVSISDVPVIYENDSIKYTIYTEGLYRMISISDYGCTSEMNSYITVEEKDQPADQTVIYSSLEYCSTDAGVVLSLEDSEVDVTYTVVNEDTGNVIEEIINESTGELKLGTFTEGTYSFIASRGGDACITSINGGESLTISIATTPETYEIKTDNPMVCGSENAVIYLDGFEIGREYMLVNSADIQEGEVITGVDGGEVSWEVTDVAGTDEIYEVLALSGESCNLSMGTIQIYYLNGPTSFNVTQTELIYCIDDDGVEIEISGLESNIYYWLVDVNDISVPLDVIYGTSASQTETFDGFYPEGEYTVIAKATSSGCDLAYETTITVTTSEGPDVLSRVASCTNDEDIVSEGCVVDDELCIEVAEENVVYSLYNEDDLDNPVESIPITDENKGQVVCFSPIEEEGNYIIQAQSTLYPYCINNFEESYYFDHKDYGSLVAVDDIFNVKSNVLTDTINLRVNDTIIYIDEYDEPQPIPYGNTPDLNTYTFVDKYYEDFGSDANLSYYLLEDHVVRTTEINNDTVGNFTIDIDTGELAYKRTPGFYGKYRLEYIVENSEYEGRIDTAIVTLYLGNEDADDDKSFLIPNAFSPNGDGINDYYVISGKEGGLTATKSKLEVFNRWGVLVYRSTSVVYGEGDEWWDGTSTTANMVSIGNDLPNGTYFYVFEVEINTGEEVVNKKYNGYIELRR